MTLRFFFILFLVLDVLVFAIARGVFGTNALPDKVEPERIVQQIRPDSIKILDEAQLRALKRPPCIAWSGLTPAQSNKLLSLLNIAGIQAGARDIQMPMVFKVRIPPLPTREAAEILAENMAAGLGISADSFSVEEGAGGKSAIVFGQFATRAEAVSRFEAIKARGVPNAGIEEIRGVIERQIHAVSTADKVETVLTGQPFARLHKACPQ